MGLTAFPLIQLRFEISKLLLIADRNTKRLAVPDDIRPFTEKDAERYLDLSVSSLLLRSIMVL